MKMMQILLKNHSCKIKLNVTITSIDKVHAINQLCCNMKNKISLDNGLFRICQN